MLDQQNKNNRPVMTAGRGLTRLPAVTTRWLFLFCRSNMKWTLAYALYPPPSSPFCDLYTFRVCSTITVCKHISVTQQTPVGGLLASHTSTPRRAFFWFRKLSVIRWMCVWRRLKMQEMNTVSSFVSFASNSGPDDLEAGIVVLFSYSSRWKSLGPVTATQLPGCEPQLSG